MTTTRDAFEAHWRSIQSPSKANRELNQRDGNEYAHGHVARHWLTWQAATLAEKRQPLTVGEIRDLWDAQLFNITDRSLATDFVRDVETAHGIKA